MRSLLALAFALTACADDPFNALPGGPDTGGLSCAEIVDCSADCDSDSCDQACFDDGSAEAQQLIGDITRCIAEHQCETNDCVAVNCGLLFDQCVGGGGNNSPGGNNNAGSSCTEIIDCMADCNNDACANACIDDGSSEAQDLFGDLDTCIAANECSDFDCVEQRCGGQLDACFDDTGGGTTGPTGSMLPASIVGEWNASSVTTTAGSITTYIFTADGRVSERSLLTFDDITGCENTFSTEYEGVVQLSGNTLNITVIDGSFTSTKCNETPTTGPHEDPERFSFATGVDEAGELLQLTNIDNGITVTYRH